MVQSIQQRTYDYGLEIHKGLVSHSNFAEISAFMPSLKVLIQIATQLQVHRQL
jgi:protein transport protein SEC31